MMTTFVLKLIRLYQVGIAPHLMPSCRFTPSCSDYWVLAIRTQGLVKGIWLGIRRLLRCHPFCQPGEDPVLIKE